MTEQGGGRLEGDVQEEIRENLEGTHSSGGPIQLQRDTIIQSKSDVILDKSECCHVLLLACVQEDREREIERE